MENLIGPEFLEKTRYQYLERSDQMRGVPSPPLELPFDPSRDRIPLPDPLKCRVSPVDLSDAIERRKSVRSYLNKALTTDELSYLLWCTQGVKQVIPNTGTLRTVPSAGARHAFETVLLINRVDNIEQGLYRYLALEHELIQIERGSQIADRVMEGCLGQRMVIESAVTFIWIAVPYRMTWRYGQRGYRYLYLDAGHVCQNLYLSAEAVGCGVCAIAAFGDQEMNQCLGLDGLSQFVIYVATVGKK